VREDVVRGLYLDGVEEAYVGNNIIILILTLIIIIITIIIITIIIIIIITPFSTGSLGRSCGCGRTWCGDSTWMVWRRLMWAAARRSTSS
jgi:hypothetical protein